MKTIKSRNGLVYTHISHNGVTRVEVQPYDQWELRFRHEVWAEKASETIDVL